MPVEPVLLLDKSKSFHFKVTLDEPITGTYYPRVFGTDYLGKEFETDDTDEHDTEHAMTFTNVLRMLSAIRKQFYSLALMMQDFSRRWKNCLCT